MAHRTFIAAALAAGSALVVGAVFLAPHPALADVAEDIKAFEDYVKTNPTPDALCNKIADLGQKHDPAVAACLLKLNLLRNKDEKVVITTAQAVGKQKDPKVAVTLEAMADAKDIEKEKKWKILGALLEGIGDADAKGHYKYLIDTAKKYLDLNGDVAGPAFRAASQHVSRDTVDDLVSALETCDAGVTANAVSKRVPRNATKPVILEALKRVTGKDIEDTKAWSDWWKENKKTWKPPSAGGDKAVDLNASDTFTEDVYHVSIKKANKAWTFRRGEGHHLLSIEALDEGQKAAWVELFVEGTGNLKSKTPEAYADEMKGNIEPKFRDIKSAEWSRKCGYGGLTGIEQIVDGQHKDHDVVHMHNVFLDNKGFMFYISTFWKSGKKASLKDDVEEIIKSFHLTK